MKTKILVFMLTLFLISPVIAQDKSISFGFKVKRAIEDGEQPISIQAKVGDKAKTVTFVAYVSDKNDEINHYLKLSQNNTIYFNIEYAAVLASNVRFHFAMTGPEAFAYSTDWVEGKTNSYYLYWISTNNNWKKGTYKMVVMAEPKKGGSGAECVATCVFKFY